MSSFEVIEEGGRGGGGGGGGEERGFRLATSRPHESF